MRLIAKLAVPVWVDWNDIKDHMAKLDIVEVVRCKDCVYHDGKDGQCPLQWSGDPYIDIEPQDYFYCAYAERRTDE